jgi:ribonuclease T2
MNTYWVDINGDDESFWEHEWAKHGTCISTFDTSCYTDYTPQEEVPDFFQATVDLFKTLDSYTVPPPIPMPPPIIAKYIPRHFQMLALFLPARQLTLPPPSSPP